MRVRRASRIPPRASFADHRREQRESVCAGVYEAAEDCEYVLVIQARTIHELAVAEYINSNISERAELIEGIVYDVLSEYEAHTTPCKRRKNVIE